MTLTVTALKWVPPFAAGQVRDYRVRWILNEVGWPYEVRLIDAPTQKSEAYRQMQPFGQVPCLIEDDRPPMFETGAIVIDIATRAGQLIPAEGPERAQVLEWVIAALNSVEPFLMNVAEAEYFIQDPEHKALRRPVVREMAQSRLSALEVALGERIWLVGDSFTIADLMMGSVLEIARRLDLLTELSALADYQAQCFDRPSLRQAIEDQQADIGRHQMADMRYGETP